MNTTYRLWHSTQLSITYNLGSLDLDEFDETISQLIPPLIQKPLAFLAIMCHDRKKE